MNIYLWSKLLHLFFVIAWMATVFGLPRTLLGLAEADADDPQRARLITSGRRLYRLGHNLFGLAVVFGLVLWLYLGIGGPWLHVKLVLVALLLTHFTVGGRWLKGAAAGRALPSVRVLWWFGNVPAVLLFVVIWLVLAKPH